MPECELRAPSAPRTQGPGRSEHFCQEHGLPAAFEGAQKPSHRGLRARQRLGRQRERHSGCVPSVGQLSVGSRFHFGFDRRKRDRRRGNIRHALLDKVVRSWGRLVGKPLFRSGHLDRLPPWTVGRGRFGFAEFTRPGLVRRPLEQGAHDGKRPRTA